jgi:hypothetical protein
MTDKVMRALYTHGPCSAATLAAIVGEQDVESVARAVATLGHQVAARTVALPGLGVEPVRLLYLRGNGVG